MMTQQAVRLNDGPHQSNMVEKVLKRFQQAALKVFCEGTLGAKGQKVEIIQARFKNEHYQR